jgi:uncharacterized protein YdiU (UPF0061 family)
MVHFGGRDRLLNVGAKGYGKAPYSREAEARKCYNGPLPIRRAVLTRLSHGHIRVDRF